MLILRDILIVSPFQFVFIIFNSIVAAFIVVIINRSISNIIIVIFSVIIRRSYSLRESVFERCILLTSMEVTSSMMISLGC